MKAEGDRWLRAVLAAFPLAAKDSKERKKNNTTLGVQRVVFWLLSSVFIGIHRSRFPRCVFVSP